MNDLTNLWGLMRLPMARWWDRAGRWLILPVALLTAGAALHYMLMPNMPLQEWLINKQVASSAMIKSAQRFLSVPIMLLLYAFIGLWASAAISCQREMRRLLYESAAPSFDASPLQRLLVCYGQGTLIMPVALIVYTGLGFLSALADRMSPHSIQTMVQFGTSFGGSSTNVLLPGHYVNLVESISQFSSSAFAIGALSLWITALAVAGGSLAGGSFLALRSLDVAILSGVLVLGDGHIFSGRPLIREALPIGEFWWCIPLMLTAVALFGIARRWSRTAALTLLAMLALAPAFFTTVLPTSLFYEDTLFARLVNSLRYMYYGIAGPVFQVKASMIEGEQALRFREHLVLYSDSSLVLFPCTGSAIMLSWLGNLLVLGVILLMVMAVLKLSLPARLSRTH
ncbi:MAG: hypothetical protein H7A35_00270 [Planctomycetales bacterium]|nr:hypothetical protein [bacterium]UNM08497.1 MAG: hypothetical protein H7A35_00270 [Planctomycetales bacterium]